MWVKKIKGWGGNKKTSFGLTQPFPAPSWTHHCWGSTRLRTSSKGQELFKPTPQQGKDLTPKLFSQTHVWCSVAVRFTAFLSVYILTRWSQHTKGQTNSFNIEVSEPAKKKKSLFPTVFIHTLGKGHEPLPKDLCWLVEVPRQHCWWYLTTRATAAGVRARFYPNRVLVFQAFHMVINCISVQGAHSTSALMLS